MFGELVGKIGVSFLKKYEKLALIDAILNPLGAAFFAVLLAIQVVVALSEVTGVGDCGKCIVWWFLNMLISSLSTVSQVNINQSISMIYKSFNLC